MFTMKQMPSQGIVAGDFSMHVDVLHVRHGLSCDVGFAYLDSSLHRERFLNALIFQHG